MERISIIINDITKLKAEAIVNAANKSLLGGGGVDGAIHRAAGRQLYEECKKLNGCETGEAKITGGYNLPAKYVIHTVGPFWNGERNKESELLKNCYINCLKIATQYQIKSIGFPSISTGAYRYPIDKAAKVAISTVLEYTFNHDKPNTIFFVCFSVSDLEVYLNTFNEFKG